jgi:hypothetical protein
MGISYPLFRAGNREIRKGGDPPRRNKTLDNRLKFIEERGRNP